MPWVHHVEMEGGKPYLGIPRENRTAALYDAGGKTIFHQEKITAPADWSDLAITIAATKYFVKAGAPTPDGRENNVFDMVKGVSEAIATAGFDYGYFQSTEAAERFSNDLSAALIRQQCAFNSPVWFNVRHWSYGIKGEGGNWAWSEELKAAVETTNAYERPQVSACFILPLKDSLLGPDGIMKTWEAEARLFKYGSGSGVNFSPLRERGAKLSGGWTSSGMMSFLEVGDRNAGAIKSGSVARRAAKMVCVDVDHPEIVEFITWKAREERKAAALIAAGFSGGMEGEAYSTVSGQNANNSVRVTDAFMQCVVTDQPWNLKSRVDGSTTATLPARKIWRAIAQAAWECADPGVQYDTTINEWHTTPKAGRIDASSPCSEYMSLPDSACNLSSIRLTKFLTDAGGFDDASFLMLCETLIVAQDILVDYASYPTRGIAEGSHQYRQLGLGYADLGALLMRLGLGYGSKEGRDLAASITSLMTAQAYLTSARLAQAKGPFPGYAKDSEGVLRILAKHKHANAKHTDQCTGRARYLAVRAGFVWDTACTVAADYGVRNAQVTLLAPTGTIGFLMDCTTTGVEPLLGLVQYKTLIGGGRLKLSCGELSAALQRLHYTPTEVSNLVTYVEGRGTLTGCPETPDLSVFPDTVRDRISTLLRGARSVGEVFTPSALGSDACHLLGITDSDISDPKYNLLTHYWNMSEADIEACDNYACGHGTLEGSELRVLHLPIFDTAYPSGKGVRSLTTKDHLLMMAAVQPFLSGAISKTCNLPFTATVDDIADTYMEGWKLGLKAVAVYRDGSKGVQAVETKKGEEKPKEAKEGPAFKRTQRKLPPVRRGLTWAVVLDGHKIYITSGEYEDGTLGEIFLNIAREGSTLGGLCGVWAKTVSQGLQYGVPLEEFVESFTHTRFEPMGMVGKHPSIKLATSIVDLVMRVLAVHYLKRTDLQHIQEGAMDPNTMPAVIVSKPTQSHGDGPPCTQCGNITYRNGSCYRCHACGTSMGCS